MIVAVTSKITYEKNYHEVRDSISHDLSNFFLNQKIFMTILPNINLDPKKFFKKMPFDLLVLSGGDNINLTNIKKNSRENTEINFLLFCIKYKIPVIGICRGMQFINKYFGGGLTIDNKSKHVNKFHKVSSKIKFDFFPTKNFIVNSFHRNVINYDDLSNALNPICFADDKSIEGFIHKKYPIIGIMWHPERNFVENKTNTFFKKSFLKKANKFLINSL